jgi:hypothetical protein
MVSFIQAGYAPMMAFALGFDGPLLDLKTYEDYEKSFQKFLQVMCFESRIHYLEEFSSVPLFSYREGPSRSTPISSSKFIKIINECDEVIVWLSLGFHENLLLAFVIRLFTLYSLPLEKIKVRRLEAQTINEKSEKVLSVGHILPHRLAPAAPPTTLEQTEINLLIKGWEAITSSNPEVIEAYLGLPSTTSFQEGLKDFRHRLPSSKIGLNRYQTELLEAYPLDQSSVNAYYLVNAVIGKWRLDMVNDLYVQWNLLLMTDLYALKPAFIIKDPFTREHHAFITDFGRTLLEGKINWQDYNPVDYYVGGLHIQSMPSSLPQRQS